MGGFGLRFVRTKVRLKEGKIEPRRLTLRVCFERGTKTVDCQLRPVVRGRKASQVVVYERPQSRVRGFLVGRFIQMP